MKENKKLWYGNLALAIASILCGVFYVLADYGKVITGYGGLCWLAVGLYLLVCFFLKADKAYGLGALAVAAIQVPIIMCYVYYYGIVPYFPRLGELPYVSLVGIILHPLLLIAATVLAVCSFKPDLFKTPA